MRQTGFDRDMHTGISTRKGITLTEIIIALMILSLVLLGLTNIYVVSKRFILQSRSKVTAAEISRYFFEDNSILSVREDFRSANTSCLYNDSDCPADRNLSLDAKQFNGTYAVSGVEDIPSGQPTQLRRVILNVTWNEPTL